MRAAKTSLAAKDALRLRQAEQWLRTGEAAKALYELQRLTRRAWRHVRTDELIWQAAIEVEQLSKRPGLSPA